jgi:hypothetical protein
VLSTLLALCLAAPAAPEPTLVVVLPLVISGDREPLSGTDVVAAVSAAVARRPTVRTTDLGGLDELSGDAPVRLRSCGPDVMCVGNVLRGAGVPIGLLVVVNTRVSPPVVALRAVSDGAVRAERIDSRSSLEGPMVDAITRAAAIVFDELGHPAWAQLLVEVSPPDARVSVDEPAAEPRGDRIWLVPPGTVTVRADAPEHTRGEQAVALLAGEDRTVILTLEREAVWWESPWFWGAVGVGVAAGVVGTALALPSGDRCLCVGHPSAPCPCP